MKIEVTQCSMCTHYNTEQFCEVWKQYIFNDAFYCACGVKADRKTENCSEKTNNSTISKMEQVDKDINVRSKDEPQTEECPFDDPIPCEWVNCPNSTDCPYKQKTEPQTDCTTCEQAGRCERGRAVECPLTERSE